MEILILKNNEIYARATAEEGTAADYTMVIAEDVPEYPKKNPNTGKYWELVYREGVLSWEEKDRPLTAEERLELVEAEVDAIKHEWKVGEAVNVGDRRYYMGSWYTCLQAHTTQADWTPDIVPALWQKE